MNYNIEYTVSGADFAAPKPQAAAYNAADMWAPATMAWSPCDYGPNAAVEYDLPELRNKCRDASRNNARAKAGEDQLVTNVVGRGPRPTLLVEDQDLRKRYMEWWDIVSQSIDADGVLTAGEMVATAFRTEIVSGECLALRRLRPINNPRYPVPLQVQLAEGDHLDYGLNRGDNVRMGIETNRRAERVAYHLHRNHPGDSYAFTNKVDRWRAEDVSHIYKVLRPGQLRGVPRLAPALTILRQLDDFEHATLERVKLAASFAGAIINGTGQFDFEKIFAKVTGGPVAGRTSFYKQMGPVKPGTFPVLFPGDEMRFFQPPDVGAMFQANVHNFLRAIAAVFGITFEMLTGYMKDVNFASARVRLLDIRRGFGVEQLRLERQFCTPCLWQWPFRALQAAGILPVPDDPRQQWLLMNPVWVWPKFDYVNPLQESQANALNVGMAAKPLDDVRAENGLDPEACEQRIAATNDRHEKLGIRGSVDPALIEAESGDDD